MDWVVRPLVAKRPICQHICRGCEGCRMTRWLGLALCFGPHATYGGDPEDVGCHSPCGVCGSCLWEGGTAMDESNGCI